MMRLEHLVDLGLSILLLVLLPYFSFVLAMSCAAVFLGKRNADRPGTGMGRPSPLSRFLVVIPARDEELVMAETVLSATALDYPAELFQVLVIADNCSDGTADRARAAGARVIERFDAAKMSKGYASSISSRYCANPASSMPWMPSSSSMPTRPWIRTPPEVRPRSRVGVRLDPVLRLRRQRRSVVADPADGLLVQPG